MKKRMFATVAAILISTTMLLVLFCLLGRVSFGVSSAAMASPLQVTPMVALVDPASAPNDLDTPIVITGTDFVSTPTVYLGDTSLDDVNWVSTTTLEATVPWGMEPGVYTLTVENPGGESGSLSDAFTVTEGIGVWNAGEFYGGRVEQLVINPLTPTTVYAVSMHAGLFRSRDGGDSWSLKSAGPCYIVRRLAIDPLSPNRLYLFESGRSDDEGDNLDTPGYARGVTRAVAISTSPHIWDRVCEQSHPGRLWPLEVNKLR